MARGGKQRIYGKWVFVPIFPSIQFQLHPQHHTYRTARTFCYLSPIPATRGSSSLPHMSIRYKPPTVIVRTPSENDNENWVVNHRVIVASPCCPPTILLSPLPPQQLWRNNICIYSRVEREGRKFSAAPGVWNISNQCNQIVTVQNANISIRAIMSRFIITDATTTKQMHKWIDVCRL